MASTPTLLVFPLPEIAPSHRCLPPIPPLDRSSLATILFLPAANISSLVEEGTHTAHRKTSRLLTIHSSGRSLGIAPALVQVHVRASWFTMVVSAVIRTMSSTPLNSRTPNGRS